MTGGRVFFSLPPIVMCAYLSIYKIFIKEYIPNGIPY
ncbi:Uncharacterised protein [uncultured Ruminococcus sp.]|nr:Uncharacterised protein [uncultured Ruminococcus sp.]